MRVLEYSLAEVQAREQGLRQAAAEAQYLEEQARRVMAGARDELVANQVRCSADWLCPGSSVHSCMQQGSGSSCCWCTDAKILSSNNRF